MSQTKTLDWLATELREILPGVATLSPTYTVAVWCGEPSGMPDDDHAGPFGWVEVARGVGRWPLRRVLRHLYSCGWSDVSVLVSREE